MEPAFTVLLLDDGVRASVLPETNCAFASYKVVFSSKTFRRPQSTVANCRT